VPRHERFGEPDGDALVDSSARGVPRAANPIARSREGADREGQRAEHGP
jgi:hypothetical protein